jgi:hypothetical protein
MARKLIGLLVAALICASPALAGHLSPNTATIVPGLMLAETADTVSTTATEYFNVSGTDDADDGTQVPQMRFYGAYQFSNLSCAVTENFPGAGKSYTITLQVGGSDTALTVTISGAAGVTATDTTHVVVLNGDGTYGASGLRYKVVPSGTPATNHISCSMAVTPLGGSNPVPMMLTANGGSLPTGTTAKIAKISGYNVTDTGATTDGCSVDYFTRFPFGAVLRNLHCSAKGAISSGSVAVSVSINACTAAATALTTTLNSSFQNNSDQTNTVVVTPGGFASLIFTPSSPTYGDDNWTCSVEVDPIGGVSPTAPVYTRSVDYTITANDLAPALETTFLCDTSGATRTLTLPAANSVPGKKIRVKKISASNTCTLDGNASETIDGGTTYDILSDNSVVTIISDGSNWRII